MRPSSATSGVVPARLSQPLLLMVILLLVPCSASLLRAQPASAGEESVESEPGSLDLTIAEPEAANPDSPPEAAATPPQVQGRQIQEPGEVFINANTAYETGDPAKAIRLYEELLGQGLEEGHLYYNLGNAYLRNGELGRAVASYRRSEVLLPRHQDVKANLAFARKSSRDAIAPPQPSAVQSTLFFWHFGLSRAELGRLVLLVNLLLWGVLGLRLFRPTSELLRWSFISLLILLSATSASLLLRHALPAQIAVVVPQEIDVFNGPSLEAVVRFKLHAGTEVLLEERRPDWLRISLPDGQQGWIQESWAEVVEL